MKRVYNFCSGPATMPLAVLEKAQRDFLNWKDIGASVMEISHRSKEFEEIMTLCDERLRRLLSIPTHYKVLFLQGGAYGQFSAIPLNLLGDKTSIDVIDTGIWSGKAIASAQNYAKVNVIASSKDNQYRSLPDESSFVINQESAYLHICSNETINGVEFSYDIDSPIPLVADMSSNILSKAINVNNYGIIYAGAQKNIGPSGVTVVIVREDLLDRAKKNTPDVLNYTLQSKNNSMLNTPPTFSIYMMGLVLEWLEGLGGISVMEEINRKKAKLLYDVIDHSSFYDNAIDSAARSNMNIPFTLQNSMLDKKFLQDAEDRGLINLSGHRSVGGMRASIYNAMPLEGVQALCSFMVDFEKQNS